MVMKWADTSHQKPHQMESYKRSNKQYKHTAEEKQYLKNYWKVKELYILS